MRSSWCFPGSSFWLERALSSPSWEAVGQTQEDFLLREAGATTKPQAEGCCTCLPSLSSSLPPGGCGSPLFPVTPSDTAAGTEQAQSPKKGQKGKSGPQVGSLGNSKRAQDPRARKDSRIPIDSSLHFSCLPSKQFGSPDKVILYADGGLSTLDIY